MKKFLSLLLVFAACYGNISAQTSKQGNNNNPVVMNNVPGPNIAMNDKDFTFDDIEFWVGEGSNQAAIVIQWNDENTPNTIVWGYRWDGDAYGIDMFKAVAEADPRLVLLTQYTGSMGNTVCGIGYDEESFFVEYDLEHAMNNSSNAFDFVEPMDNKLGQTMVPETPLEDIENAIEEGLENGVIYHPLNAEIYGYPSYDYDSWSSPDAMHWDAGWYSGYWSYYVRDSQEDDFGYSGLGFSSRKLENGSWDVWMYNDFAAGMSTLSETFTAATVVSTGIKDEVINNAKIMTNENVIRLVNMNGYNCVITDVTGKVIKSFTVSNNDDLVSLNANGLYIISAVNGNEKINRKVVVK